jgi:hypothetical protein
MQIGTQGTVPDGFGAGWTATTPSPALSIVRMYTPPGSVSVDCTLAGDGYTARFFWESGGEQTISPIGPAVKGNTCAGDGILRSIAPSRWVSWASGCYLHNPCYPAADDNVLLLVRGVDLTVEEDTGPAIHPTGFDNLWYQTNKWVRGSWPISFTANDPSGVCSTAASVDGSLIQGSVDYWLDTSNWQQCPELGFDHQLDTTQYPNGSMSLSLHAGNAPGIESSPSELVNVDNQPVGLTLAGPTDALSTAGTQYVTATASAGPSGVSAILCSLDGAPAQSYPGPAVRIPVQGLGAHHLSCTARNGAIDSHNALASSPPESWTLSLRQPSVSTVSFAHIADKLHCAKQRERVKVPARWIYERVHGRRVRVHIPAQTRTVKVVHCHPNVAARRTIRRRRTVNFGARTKISGWLGTSEGNALGGQHVRILTAPSDGRRRFTTVATAVTNPDGGWTVRLPAGPSRVVRAAYDGSPTVEPANSAPAHVVVPAAARLRIQPLATHWGGTIRIDGRLRGGHIPRAGELVVLWIGWSGGSAEIGHLYAHRDGRFRSPYTFLRGNGTVTYRLWAATARESDYPFAAARSPMTAVTVRP